MGLDSIKLNADGFAPVQKYLDAVFAVKDKAELVKKVADFHLTGETAFFDAGVDSDLMDSATNVFYLIQGGLGLGDKDYYVDPSNQAIQDGYRNFIADIFKLSGCVADPEKSAAAVVDFEDKLAEVSWTSVENRDYTKQYNPMSTAQVEKAYPGFDFASYFKTCGIPDVDKIIVMQPSFFEGFSKLFASTDLETLKAYMAASLISGACTAVSDEYYDAYFDFFSRQMTGTTEKKPRWKRAMSVPNSILSEAVGQMYVAKYFPESSKQQVLDLVENLRTALGEHISNLDWMGDATKAYALDKLAAFTVKIGYPDKWKDYSGITVDPQQPYYENLREVSKWYVQDNLSKLGKPVDKEEWLMSPQTVNAYYNPSSNEICFPAAILQPPFFDPNADDAVNYGAIGVVIGHEMTHGFDDQGRLFDKVGNMTNWWTDADDKAFREKSQVLVDQFNEVQILPDLMANGELCLGENIADHGGLSIAYTALHNAIEGKDPGIIDGFTPEQRFFLGYARVWAQNITDEEKARLTKLDVHSLAENRVNVSLRNFQEFFDAFGIKEGDKMYRPESERVHIW